MSALTTPAEPPMLLPTAPSADAPVNILLVDDEPKNLIALDAVLQQDDWRLVHAGSGHEALRQVLQHEFAAILLDVQMPGLDGFETAQLIRERERSRDVPILFLPAASRSEAFVARGYSVGAVDYLLKPFDPAILRSKVAVFVDLFRKTAQVKRQAEQLAETTEFLNSVLEGSTDHSITAMDLEGRFLAWNAGARRLYGYDAAEMVGRQTLHALHTPDDRKTGRPEMLLRTARLRGKAEALLEGVRKNGHRFWATVTVAPRRNAAGQVVGYVSISRDVTDRVRAEEERAALIQERAARAEAEAARDRLHQIVDALPEAILLADASGRIYLNNAAAEDLLGEVPPPVPLAEHAVFGVLRLDGTPYPVDELPLSRAILRGEAVRGEQMLIPNAITGQSVPVLVNGAPLRDASGAITGGLVVFQDISAIKDLEREKDAFLAAASHDLKSPLTAIKARAQILERRLRRLDQPELIPIADGLQSVDQTSTRLTGMINELLDVTRLQMGRPLDLDRQLTDLVSLAQQVIGDMQSLSERHTLDVETQAKALVGVWDAARLERVVTNLVANAIKFSPQGGPVTLSLDRQARDGREWAVLSVQDQGLGIPSDELPRVFDRFYRASNVSGKIEGTGIGLSGARQIVEQHGGSITVESTEGRGSRFTVYLPVDGDCDSCLVSAAPVGSAAAPAPPCTSTPSPGSLEHA